AAVAAAEPAHEREPALGAADPGHAHHRREGAGLVLGGLAIDPVELPEVDRVEVLDVDDVLGREEEAGRGEAAAGVGDRRGPAVEEAGLGEAERAIGPGAVGAVPDEDRGRALDRGPGGGADVAEVPRVLDEVALDALAAAVEVEPVEGATD